MPPPIPSPTSTDSGKVLTVSENGCPVWGEGDKTINGGYDQETMIILTDITQTRPTKTYETDYLPGDAGVSIYEYFTNNVGKTVKVTLNGTTYECTVNAASNGGAFIGDIKNVEYPFYLYAGILVDRNPMEAAFMDVLDEIIPAGESYNLKIEAPAVVPVVFDKKYIPDMQTLTGSTTSDSGKFLTVGTDGKPTWTSISNAEGGSY